MESDPGFGAAPGGDDELVKRMVSAMIDADNALPHDWPDFEAYAYAALSVARQAIKEECARKLEDRLLARYGYDKHGDVAAIRAMK